jgi:dienelactone hydrolase
VNYRLLIFVTLCLLSIAARGAELVRITGQLPSGDVPEFEAEYRAPAGASSTAKVPAVILIHSGWGWNERVTEQYAIALEKEGFAVLQPRFFRTHKEARPPGTYVQHAYAALAYLAARPEIDGKRVAIAGFSFGGIVALLTAVERNAASNGKDGLRFAAHAPFYPLCYAFENLATGKTKGSMPPEEFRRYTGAPVRIYAGGKDDYEDRDPEICQNFVNLVAEPARARFSIQLYPNATHGWDQAETAQFHTAAACKGRGCRNLNSPDRAIAAQGIADLVAFMKRTLAAK